MSIRHRFAAFAVAALLAFCAGCAATPLPGRQEVQPGDTFAFEGKQYRLQQLQEDFIVLRYRDPEESPGPISGFVDEVFRVSRYELGKGRWYAHERLPGVYLQWLGLDSFALARGADRPRGIEVTMLR